MVLVDRVELEQRLQQHLRTVDTAFPSAWRDLARARVTHDRASRVRWPRWCWVPTGVADPIVERGQRPTRSPQERLEALAAGPVVVGLGAWRIGKGVYRFDDTLATALDTADGVDMIDPLVLHALPEWCVYILDDHRLTQTTPSGPVTAVVHGYFVWLDHDLGSGRPELRLLLDLDDGHLAPAVAYLDRSSLYDGVLDAVASTIVTVLGDSPADLHLDGDLDRLGGHTARRCRYRCASDRFADPCGRTRDKVPSRVYPASADVQGRPSASTQPPEQVIWTIVDAWRRHESSSQADSHRSTSSRRAAASAVAFGRSPSPRTYPAVVAGLA